MASSVLTATEPFVHLRDEHYESGHLHGTFESLTEGLVEPPGLLVSHRDRLSEMLYERVVNTFITYLSHLLALVFKTRPGTLCVRFENAEEPTVKISRLLEHKSLDDLLVSIADHRVQQVSFWGLRDMNTRIRNQLAFELFSSESDLDRAVQLVEKRNLIVHNYAIVNDVYLSRTGDQSVSVGDRITIDVPSITGDASFLIVHARDIDSRAVSKWHLPTIEIPARSLS